MAAIQRLVDLWVTHKIMLHALLLNVIESESNRRFNQQNQVRIPELKSVFDSNTVYIRPRCEFVQ